MAHNDIVHMEMPDIIVTMVNLSHIHLLSMQQHVLSVLRKCI